MIAVLFGPSDRVIMDTLSHRSLLDACRMAGVQIQRFRHNDPESLRQEIQNGATANRTLIISDGVFSMDGDICILPELIAIKKEFGCFLLVDESHASGVLGRHGRGTDEHFGVGLQRRGHLDRVAGEGDSFEWRLRRRVAAALHLPAACVSAVHFFRSHGSAGDCGGERGAGGAEG